MAYLIKSILLIALLFSYASCSVNKISNSKMESKTIMEVTTFRISSNVSPAEFSKNDLQVESNFTSEQPGFIRRQSAVDDEGNYVVIVYWENIAAATASMTKFMSDASVAAYAQMIDSQTMNMQRYTMDKPFNAETSAFVELMTYDLKSETDIDNFNRVNRQVETDFTSKRKGFLQRLTGSNEEGRQAVAVYWENKKLSDASISAFMDAPVSQAFMENMDQSTISMGRYKFLNSELTNKE